MIYFDNSATTLIKPPQVGEAVKYAVNNFGNAGRSFYGAVLNANREIYNTREEIAKLIGCPDPLNIAFTSSATESLNLVINALIKKTHSVITTVSEHNSLLRPLYLKGCGIRVMDCDEKGNLKTDSFDALVKPDTKFFLCTHGSNVTGNITNVYKLYKLCKERNITMILDVSQTLGSIPVKIDMADIFCFTGHKALFGPQGTGGIITNGKFDFAVVKTGGAGVDSFKRVQSGDMPDIFEVGTLNSHSLYGLQKGVCYVNERGVETIHQEESLLLKLFYQGIKDIKGIKIYGDFDCKDRLPILSLNLFPLTSSELAQKLWEDYEIATRAGSHCAPLLHKRFGTVNSGMVRFSFCCFNTKKEVYKGIDALKRIAQSL